MGHGSAQSLKGDFFPGHGLDHIGAGDEHITGFLDHKNKIRHGR